MARHPEPGRVKTRLARVLGTNAATALYRAFILDLADRLATLPYAVTWAVDPPGAPFTTVVPHARCRAQEGADLGERMTRAFAAEFAEGGGAVAMIGADIPHLPATVFAETAAALGRDADVVLGPAEDGGYYLVGLTVPAPALFTGVAWSTPDVLATTLARARDAGLRTHLLPPTFDVDEPADLDRLAGLVDGGAATLPHTAAVLAALHRLGS
ncbi:MAG TPA: TIGR04282 family arsenosugar biosynthesis glycosyltransferase [Candidatus Binatia bacterium]|nr:TIGR04282 family arsenosugar biosynthesis glycosyltransferase [Candidatus Binatia bacterium]